MTPIIIIADNIPEIDLIERVGDRLQKTFGAKRLQYLEAAAPSSTTPERLRSRSIVLLFLPTVLTSMGQIELTAPASQLLQNAVINEFPIIPILLKDSQMLPASAFPPELRAIAQRNGLRLRSGSDFANDLEHLTRAIIYVEHQRADSEIPAEPTTFPEAFIQHLRRPQSRRAFALLITSLALGRGLIYVNAVLHQDWDYSNSSMHIVFMPANMGVSQFVNAFVYAAPMMCVGLSLFWLCTLNRQAFARSTIIATMLLVIVLALPAGFNFLISLNDSSMNSFYFLDVGLQLNYKVTLTDNNTGPLIIAIICSFTLVVLCSWLRQFWQTCLAAGAVIIFALDGASVEGPPFLNLLTLAAFIGLIIASVFVVVRAFRYRRWVWCIAATILPIMSVAFVQYSIANAISVYLHLISTSIPNQIITSLALRTPLVVVNVLWPCIIFLAPWLIQERGTQQKAATTVDLAQASK